MGVTIAGLSVLGTIFFGILFGFGFAIGGWLWAALVQAIRSAVNRPKPAA